MYISIVPKTLEETLLNYTRQGYRVLSLAHRRFGNDLDFQNLNRIKRYTFISFHFN